MTVLDMRPKDERQIFQTGAITVNINGAAAQGLSNTFYAQLGDTIEVSAAIVDGVGNILDQIDAATLGYPPVLKLPFLKVTGGDNQQILDQVYLDVTLVNGVMNATGSIPSGGAWLFSRDRINSALLSIGLDWKIQFNDVFVLA